MTFSFITKNGLWTQFVDILIVFDPLMFFVSIFRFKILWDIVCCILDVLL